MHGISNLNEKLKVGQRLQTCMQPRNPKA